jgi:hypothetical protein
MKFILYNIDPNAIDEKYNFTIKSNIESSSNTITNTTNINDINNTQKNCIYSYYDQSKKHVKCSLTMNDLVGNKLPQKTNIHCHWCRSPFQTSPIGCPIKYTNDTYIVDGIFCSFNCCKSFIHTQQHNCLYDYSENILNMLYYSIYNNYINIKKAPSWRLLKEYGGNQTIKQFRESFNTIEYINNNNYITKIPDQHVISWLVEEHLIF